MVVELCRPRVGVGGDVLGGFQLAETENKRRKKSGKNLSIEEANLLVDHMVNTVLDVLDRCDVDASARQEIADSADKPLHDGPQRKRT